MHLIVSLAAQRASLFNIHSASQTIKHERCMKRITHIDQFLELLRYVSICRPTLC
jgi:hypothetical protein